MDHLFSCVRELRAVNEDIGSTLSRQNKKLETVNSKMDSNNERMSKIDSTIQKKILR